LSLSQLAALTDGLYSKSRISNYEQGLRRPSIEAARTLAAALGVALSGADCGAVRAHPADGGAAGAGG